VFKGWLAFARLTLARDDLNPLTLSPAATCSRSLSPAGDLKRLTAPTAILAQRPKRR